MFAISVFVGSKFGGWIVGKDRYEMKAAAEFAAMCALDDEHAAVASQFLRRVVRV